MPKAERTFNLRFLTSGDRITAYINQESGKAIQSTDKQEILGNWILRGVFQLKEREVLTSRRLNELEINGIRLSKFKNGDIGIEFIWMDTENPPVDAIGWVTKDFFVNSLNIKNRAVQSCLHTRKQSRNIGNALRDYLLF